jgi:tellurite resistance protein
LTAAATELTVRDPARRDEEIMQGLVTAGALVALADGEVKTVERDELVDFIDRQGFAPMIPRAGIAETFDGRVRELEGRDGARVVVETLRPLSRQSLASVVVRTAHRVAAADREISPGEAEALRLLRRIMIDLPAAGPDTASPPQNPAECGHCGTVLIAAAWPESAAPGDAAPGDNVAIRYCPLCGHDMENRVGKKLPDELVQAFLPSLLIA